MSSIGVKCEQEKKTVLSGDKLFHQELKTDLPKMNDNHQTNYQTPIRCLYEILKILDLS